MVARPILTSSSAKFWAISVGHAACLCCDGLQARPVQGVNEQGPMTPEATKMNVAERYARVALPPGSGWVSRIRACHRQVHLPPEQAMVFAEPDSPVYLPGGFDIAAVMLER
jgi:hypothetical protein